MEEVNLESSVTGRMLRISGDDIVEYACPLNDCIKEWEIKAVQRGSKIEVRDKSGGIIKEIHGAKRKKATQILKTYSERNMDINKKGKELAMQVVYPLLFKGREFHIRVINPENGEQDLVMDRDVVADYEAEVYPDKGAVDYKFGRGDHFLIQERVIEHNPNFERTVTISVTYPNNKYACEWYKLNGLSYFVWVYYSPVNKCLVDYIVVHHPHRIRDLIRAGTIKADKRDNKKTGQIFYSIPISELEKHNLICMRMAH
ncbi:hypothetical protein ACIG6B_28595 [Bacillus mobilis]|uniref:hypothetical protein n=2 Tax=Bacteria TaxID=2 RepID=UPI00363F6D71